MHTNKTQKTKYAFTVLNTILSLFVLLYASTAFAQVDDEDSTMYKYGALEAKIFSINDEVNDLNDDLDTNIILAEEGINELDDLIQEQKKMKELSDKSINEIENNYKVKTFLVGNNLSPLHYQLVQTEDQVGQLKKMSKDLTNDAKDVQINNQLKLMLEEQARIENFILKQEDKFSLFGWLVRII